ncbi:MAG: hypothetical protein AAFV71_05965 [Cyanobacteria bacterium J06633_8]
MCINKFPLKTSGTDRPLVFDHIKYDGLGQAGGAEEAGEAGGEITPQN